MKPRPNYFAGAGSIIWLLIVLVPIYVMVTATIQTQQGYASAGPLSLPSSFTLDNFGALVTGGFLTYVWNTVIVTVSVVAIVVLVVPPLSYAVVRSRSRGISLIFRTFLLGLAIGSTLGLVLAAVITQKPFVEKIVAPYIIVLVTTPMLALVPFLRIGVIKSFSIWPIVAAVALASGPMVLINASTGFRRTDLAKIALARSYGASTFQIFRTIRFPLALPMIIVGYMVGSIFGLLTAVGGEMVSASDQGGLGHQLVFFSSLIRMANVGAVIFLIAVLGVSIYVVFFLIGKRWASWEA